MKYIDSDKLIAEIKVIQQSLESRDVRSNQVKKIRTECLIEFCKCIIDVITSLQQEQPEPTCKSCGFYENNCPFIRNTFKPYPNRVCNDYIYSVMKEQEQPEVDIAELTWEDMVEIRRIMFNINKRISTFGLKIPSDEEYGKEVLSRFLESKKEEQSNA